ncbi:MAG: Mth938-like domain-containing protein [Aigarchaeota archaeon]|nr:Mth938-like domain-containing protein [Aigarchaeota archaeon]MCX8193515.1 Mth938-like domain-containing protein [Nitrososphaeria archaeon]MDW7986818.1 Mth938-like domain-containing protein [Nitrososphaerota archaeon]
MEFKIEEYGFGYIVVNGVTYSRDLIILPERLITNWWRKEGHRIELSDLAEVLEVDVDYVVIGTGYSGRVEVSREVLEVFKKKNVEVVVEDTRNAWRRYNELVEKGFRVCGAFHLTC